jgi:hypothetical protein
MQVRSALGCQMQCDPARSHPLLPEESGSPVKDDVAARLMVDEMVVVSLRSKRCRHYPFTCGAQTTAC